MSWHYNDGLVQERRNSIDIYHYISGTGSIVAVFVLSIPALDLTNIADMLRWVFYILIPNFSMGIGIQDIYANYNNKKICTATDLSVPLDVFCAFAQNANISAPCCPGKLGESDFF